MRQDEPDARTLVDKLVGLLDLEQIEVDLFRGRRTDEPWTRVFGGQVVGQALMAACRTAPAERLPHSLHAYFLRPGNPALPIVYQVTRDRDGRSFTSRRVTAIQDGNTLLALAASFHGHEPGFAHHCAMPETIEPEDLASETEIAGASLDRIPEPRRRLALHPRPIEFRPVEGGLRLGGEAHEAAQSYWFRVIAPLPDDPVLHRVILAYASDMMLLSTSLLPHCVNWFDEGMQEASLDHALWIHEDAPLDDWLLYTMDSPWSGDARGFNRGLIYTRDGRLVASVAQEGLMRHR